MDEAVLKRRLVDLIEGVWSNGIDPMAVGARVTKFLEQNGWTLQGSGVFMFSKGNGGWVVVERNRIIHELSFCYQIPEQK